MWFLRGSAIGFVVPLFFAFVVFFPSIFFFFILSQLIAITSSRNTKIWKGGKKIACACYAMKTYTNQKNERIASTYDLWFAVILHRVFFVWFDSAP